MDLEAKILREDAAKTSLDAGTKARDHVGDFAQKVLGSCLNSFAADTPVATPTGAVAIASLAVNDQVLAYDPTTGQSKAEPVDHVFINHDTNLMDVTLAPETTIAPDRSVEDAASPKQAKAALASHGLRAPPADAKAETLHTTTEHPFLTTDRGFVNAQDLRVGEPVWQLDGQVGVAVVVTPGAAVRYNLTVHDLHTYAVGTDQWIVHNLNCKDVTYVIGESMDRVIKYAEAHGYKYWRPTGPKVNDFINDKQWVWRLRRLGYTIIDIGPDGRLDPSKYYEAEVKILQSRGGYENWFIDPDVWRLPIGKDGFPIFPNEGGK